MGGKVSRCWSQAAPGTQEDTDVHGEAVEEAEAFLEDEERSQSSVSGAEPPEPGCGLEPPPSRAVLALADKMSEDIVAQALLLCWQLEIRYSDLPFIDLECEYVIGD